MATMNNGKWGHCWKGKIVLSMLCASAGLWTVVYGKDKRRITCIVLVLYSNTQCENYEDDFVEWNRCRRRRYIEEFSPSRNGPFMASQAPLEINRTSLCCAMTSSIRSIGTAAMIQVVAKLHRSHNSESNAKQHFYVLTHERHRRFTVFYVLSNSFIVSSVHFSSKFFSATFSRYRYHGNASVQRENEAKWHFRFDFNIRNTFYNENACSCPTHLPPASSSRGRHTYREWNDQIYQRQKSATAAYEHIKRRGKHIFLINFQQISNSTYSRFGHKLRAIHRRTRLFSPRETFQFLIFPTSTSKCRVRLPAPAHTFVCWMRTPFILTCRGVACVCVRVNCKVIAHWMHRLNTNPHICTTV